MDFTSEIVWVMFGGILTTATAWIWNAGILPAIVSKFRDDTRVDGEWIWYEGKSTKAIGKMLIKQSGGRIDGTLTRATSYQGGVIERKYDIDGTIHHDILLLEFVEVADRRRRGVIALTVSQVRSMMYGRNAYIAIGDNLLVSDRYVFMESGKEDLSVEDALRLVEAKDCVQVGLIGIEQARALPEVDNAQAKED